MSGKPPFSANSMEESFRNLTRVPVPKISSKVANVPPEVEALLASMLEKKPEKRIGTAQAALFKIRAISEGLKQESEAKTAHGVPPSLGEIKVGGSSDSDAESSHDLIEVSDPKPREKQDDGLPPTRIRFEGSKTIQADTSIAPNAQEKDVGLANSKTKAEPKSVSKPVVESHKPKAARTKKSGVRKRKGRKIDSPGEDYFKPVTPEDRAALQIDSDSEVHSTTKWPLALLLLVTVGAAVIGTWFATKNPSADELYATIQGSVKFPEEVVDETENFMRLYKSDERYGEVELLNEVGQSIKDYSSLVKRLSVRARIPGDSRLTEIEDQFMKIVALGESDPTKADAKMEAFINVHSKSGSLSVRDFDCVKAAEGFRIKIVGAEDRQVERHIRGINTSINKAAKSAPQEARELYASLVKLYIDDNWGERDAERIALLKKIKGLYDATEKPEPEEESETEESAELEETGEASETDGQ